MNKIYRGCILSRLSLCCSIFIVVSITVERFLAVTRPHYRHTEIYLQILHRYIYSLVDNSKTLTVAQTNQQRQARGVLHRAVPPHRARAQLLQVPGDGDGEVLPGLYCTVLYCTVLYCTVLYCTAGEVLPGLHGVRLRLPLQAVRAPHQAQALAGRRKLCMILMLLPRLAMSDH